MSRLVTKTRELLANRPRLVTYAHIEAKTGIKVRWLEAFAAAKIEEPSCAKVESLYVFLTERQLNV